MPILADKWFEGVPSEVSFWRSWIFTKGGPWPDDYRNRLDPHLPFDNMVEEVIRDTESRELEILDVGSGPITSLGYVSKKFDIKITATDPLADAYSVLLQEAGVTPPVRTQKCFAENLLQHFGDRRFHVCHSRNALDHSLDPRSALFAMAQLLHPNGLMYIRVHRNEGVNALYTGLHNWNFDKDEKDNFVLWRDGERYLINEDLSEFVDGRLTDTETDLGPELIFFGYRKAA